MSDDEALARRLRAVERSLTDGDHEVDALRDAGEATDRIETLESRLADAEERITELEAVTQALRGYVGNVRSVNEDVERRADAALAAVERLEETVDDAAETPARERRAPAGQPVRGREQTHATDRRPRNDERSTDEADTDTDGLLARIRDALG